MSAPDATVWFYAAAAFVIPFAVHRVNRLFHQYGDPPWKTQAEKNPNEQPTGNRQPPEEAGKSASCEK